MTEKVAKYVEDSALLPYGKLPLSTLAVAKAIGHDRRVLKKYGLDIVIAAAEKKAGRDAKLGRDTKRRSLEERVDAAKLEADKLGEQVNSLLAQLALMEANAKRIGIDPEELYRPLTPPDRRVANIFGSKKSSSRGHR
ncbi:hypothetical protein [Stenotrophomonas sp. SY1]|uniref:hypothetical protein n=1 Tax=Stenotrophomonas sp. SY1 TaxID=477235 RepID=UPI001E581718|nr:hypothetical protein [Stenotrophomonas sp. SY1]MCD9087709.1 hypothetical protein [Stenotrophomonas sp. SY1]